MGPQDRLVAGRRERPSPRAVAEVHEVVPGAQLLLGLLHGLWCHGDVDVHLVSVHVGCQPLEGEGVDVQGVGVRGNRLQGNQVALQEGGISVDDDGDPLGLLGHDVPGGRRPLSDGLLRINVGVSPLDQGTQEVGLVRRPQEVLGDLRLVYGQSGIF